MTIDNDFCQFAEKFGSKQATYEELYGIYSSIKHKQVIQNHFSPPARNEGSEKNCFDSVYDKVDVKLASSTDTWPILHNKGLGEFHQIRIRGKGKDRNASCNCDQYQVEAECIHSRKFGFLFASKFPRNVEKRFEGPKSADLGALRKTHLIAFMKNYKVQCSRNHDDMNVFANAAPTKNPMKE